MGEAVMDPQDYPTVYLTNEQLHRMAGLACDALLGLQFRTDDSDRTVVHGTFVPIDRPNGLEFFEIEPDGTYRRTT